MGNAYEKRVSKKQWISSTLAKIGEREQRKPRKGGRKRMLRRFGAAPAARLRAVSIYYSRFIVSRGERERDTVNPSDNPGVWPYYISRSEEMEGRKAPPRRYNFNGGAPRCTLLSFGRRKSKGARDSHER